MRVHAAWLAIAIVPSGGCPADDDGTSSTNATVTSASTATSDPTTDPTDPTSSGGDSSGDPTTDPASSSGAMETAEPTGGSSFDCAAFGEHGAACQPGFPPDTLAMGCEDDLMNAQMYGMACVEAREAWYACKLALDCAEYAAGCQDELSAIDVACNG